MIPDQNMNTSNFELLPLKPLVQLLGFWLLEKLFRKTDGRMLYFVQIPAIFIMISRYFSSLKSFSQAISTSLVSVPLHRYIVKYVPSLISSPHNPHFFNFFLSILPFYVAQI
jgi:hypothetical protein